MNLNQEVARRKPIWIALSEFYLDTEFQHSDYDRIADIFKESKFTLTELKEIYLYEVFPVLKGNLVSVAGIWNGFDEQWLFENCQEYYEKRRSTILRAKIKLEHQFLGVTTMGHWTEIEQRL